MRDVPLVLPEIDSHDPRPPAVGGRDSVVEIAPGVWVLPDAERTPHVPNVGIVAGQKAALVVESGMGIENGRRVLAIARDLVGDLPLYLTASHFHPEHGLGAQAFAGAATIVYNVSQREELLEKGPGFIELFSGFTPAVAAALAGVEPTPPDVAYAGFCEIDLGGRTAILREFGGAHTRGDQIVWLPAERILFTGDLVEERFFAIMDDLDANGPNWIDRLDELRAMRPEVVVPGHGQTGEADLLRDVRSSLEEMQAAAESVPAEASDDQVAAILAEAEQRIGASLPDWGNREWIRPGLYNFLRTVRD